MDKIFYGLNLINLKKDKSTIIKKNKLKDFIFKDFLEKVNKILKEKKITIHKREYNPNKKTDLWRLFKRGHYRLKKINNNP